MRMKMGSKKLNFQIELYGPYCRQPRQYADRLLNLMKRTEKLLKGFGYVRGKKGSSSFID